MFSNAPINLADLLKLRSQIKAGLSESNSRKRQVIFSTSKGGNEHFPIDHKFSEEKIDDSL